MKKIAVLLSVALLAFAADQVTKYLAVAHLTPALEGRVGIERLRGFLNEKQNLAANRTVRVIENYWDFRYVENPGAAWGLFAGLPEKVRAPFFAAITIAALGFILWMFRRVPADDRWMQFALALVFGGALGNFADRVVRGYVIDFIDWHWRNRPGWHWPTFNVADAAISVGVAMLVLDSVRTWFRSRRDRRDPGALDRLGLNGEGLGLNGEGVGLNPGAAEPVASDAAPVQGEGTRL